MKVVMKKIKDLLLGGHPKKHYSYAVVKGSLLGEILVYIDSSEETHNFLIIPHMKSRFIKKQEFVFGLKEHIVDIIGKMPRYVYKVCNLQHKKNIKTNQILT